MPGFSADLRGAAEPIWEAQHAHPFVTGIGDGTLDPAKFRYYVRQDYVFLRDYGRLLALASARSPRLELQERFAEVARATLVEEMALHRSYAAEWGITVVELETEEPAPATRAYVDFLLRTAALGDFAELVAALLPCLWGYSEIGLRLARGGRPANELYARWIDSYADEDFARLAGWCREICDEIADDLGAGGRERMRDAFVESSRHELAFWEASWRFDADPSA
jgi:thiaminase/transcriptional activator TenA